MQHNAHIYENKIQNINESGMLETDSKYVSVIRILDTFSRIPTARGQKVAIKF